MEAPQSIFETPVRTNRQSGKSLLKNEKLIIDDESNRIFDAGR